eukprot:476844-Rhodomonas_salina.1
MSSAASGIPPNPSSSQVASFTSGLGVASASLVPHMAVGSTYFVPHTASAVCKQYRTSCVGLRVASVQVASSQSASA